MTTEEQHRTEAPPPFTPELVTARAGFSDRVKRQRVFRGLSYAGRAIILVYVGLDAIIFPMFRPSSRWLGGKLFVHAAQRRVGRLPAYVILVVIALPFAIAEPAKMLAVYLMASGSRLHRSIGSCRSIFHKPCYCGAALSWRRTKLLTIPWFKVVWQWLMSLRRSLLRRGRSTRIWASFVKNRDRIRRHAHFARFRRHLGSPDLRER